MKGNILIIGGGGQVGLELTDRLIQDYGKEQVFLTDIRKIEGLDETVNFSILDVLDKTGLEKLVKTFNIKNIFHLAAVLSASGEKKPKLGWDLNMNGLLNVLEVARDEKVDKVFWPSSIAVFGPDTPRDSTPQDTIMKPNTVYGISKVSGELWCNYFNEKYGLDVRSIRYPGLIGYKSMPGGGTTDYAVEIYHKALSEKKFTCFLSEDTFLPMLYMPDALNATMELMKAPIAAIKNRFSYNIGGISFSPKQIAEEITKEIPDFVCDYKPDFRQAIADSWPNSIDDIHARNDWGWKHSFSLQTMTKDILKNLKQMMQQPV